MAKPELPKVNRPADEKISSGGSIDQHTQGYIEGVLDIKKNEIKQELSEEFKNEIKVEAEKLKNEFQNIVNQNQTRVIEGLAVFVAIFTFISVNIQVLSRVEDLKSAAIFMIFMAFLIMIILSFPLFLLRIVRNDSPPKWIWVTLIVSIVLLLIVFLFSLKLNIPLNSN